MSTVGIVEGFFGPEWDNNSRKSWAPFLEAHQGEFYIYAPKRDSYLRKNWREIWPAEYITFLKDLCSHFQSHHIKFGVGFSPFGLETSLSEVDKAHLIEKGNLLKSIGIDYLGIFFDDMPVTDNLLTTQKEVIHLFEGIFPTGLIFCPSFYSYDPILDKVFGNRPVGYVEGLHQAINPSVDICWTGPKVISEEISEDHLVDVTELLGRKPFLWENLYANDGPRNCKFLKLKYFEGRENLLENVSGVSFNLMNQSELSKILYLSSVFVMKGSLRPQDAFRAACVELCGSELADLILNSRRVFLEDGLDKLSEDDKDALINEFSHFEHACANEIVDFLRGKYLVGPECLTD